MYIPNLTSMLSGGRWIEGSASIGFFFEPALRLDALPLVSPSGLLEAGIKKTHSLLQFTRDVKYPSHSLV